MVRVKDPWEDPWPYWKCVLVLAVSLLVGYPAGWFAFQFWEHRTNPGHPAWLVSCQLGMTLVVLFLLTRDGR